MSSAEPYQTPREISLALGSWLVLALASCVLHESAATGHCCYSIIAVRSYVLGLGTTGRRRSFTPTNFRLHAQVRYGMHASHAVLEPVEQ